MGIQGSDTLSAAVRIHVGKHRLGDEYSRSKLAFVLQFLAFFCNRGKDVSLMARETSPDC